MGQGGGTCPSLPAAAVAGLYPSLDPSWSACVDESRSLYHPAGRLAGWLSSPLQFCDHVGEMV